MAPKTLRKAMAAMPYDFPRMLSPKYQKAIYENLMYPSEEVEEAFRTISLPPEMTIKS